MCKLPARDGSRRTRRLRRPAGPAARHVIVFGGHFVEDGIIASSQGARTDVCVGVLEHRGGTWTPIAHRASLTETGFNGRDPVVALQSIGAERRVLEITQSLWNGGSGMTVVTLYEPDASPDGGTFHELVSAATEADDCGASERCFRYEGSLTYAPAAAADAAAARDLHLLLKGTYRNDAGRIVTIPAGPLRPASRGPCLRARQPGARRPITLESCAVAVGGIVVLSSTLHTPR